MKRDEVLEHNIDIVTDIITMYNKGASIEDIASSYTYIRTRKCSISKRKNVKDLVIKMYDNGCTINNIMEAVGVSHSTVFRIIKERYKKCNRR